VLRDLGRDLPLDATRVYVTGHSNGGMMAYRLAAEAADRIAAVASVAGMIVTVRFAPARPVPVLHVHSVNDPRALYAGGVGPPFPGTNARVTHAAVETGLARWIALDGCASQPTVADTRRAQVRGAEHTATLLVYEPCASGTVVAHWRLTGAGHGWPGSHSPLPERIMGADTTVLDAAEEVWRFVARFRRPEAPALR
jgi:polyhydroxybutyrate depolymerase